MGTLAAETVAMLRSVRSSVSVCKTSLSRCIHSNEEAATVGKVYELRTYNIWPQCFKAFLNLTSEEFHLRTAQSKLVGYWTSELGGLNEVVHIWEYGEILLGLFIHIFTTYYSPM